MSSWHQDFEVIFRLTQGIWRRGCFCLNRSWPCLHPTTTILGDSLALSCITRPLHYNRRRNSVIDSDWENCRRNWRKKKGDVARLSHYNNSIWSMLMHCNFATPFGVVLFNHHKATTLWWRGRVAGLPCYDHPILLALSLRPSAPGLITAPLCKWHAQ